VNHLNYPPRKARSGLSDSKLFSTVSYKSHNFVKIILSEINVSSFLYNTVRDFIVTRSFYRDLIEKCILVFNTVIIIFCPNLMIFEFSRQAVKVFSKIILHEFPSSAIRVIPKKFDRMAGQR